MNLTVIVLRILHIVAGIFWAGGVIALYMFIQPAARATAPQSQKFMDQLMVHQRFGRFLNTMSIITILAGGVLFIRLASVNWEWVTTGPGIGFTTGALAGILAVVLWNALVPPRLGKLAALAEIVQINGGSPPPEMSARLTRIEAEIAAAGKLDLTLTMIAVLAMATARYWVF